MRVSKAAAANTEDSNLNSGRDECDFGSFSVGVQTLTEIEELWLRSSHPVEHLSDQHRVGPRAGLGTIQNPDALFICAKAKRQQHGFNCAKAKRQQHGFICAKAKRQQQLRQGEIV